jgi:hypothetical protein
MKNLSMIYESLTPLSVGGIRQPIVVKINEEEKIYYVVSERVIMSDNVCGMWGKPYPVYTYEMTEISQVKLPTKEEIAAEESVAKAKEALKAAENALKAVKESKEKLA